MNYKLFSVDGSQLAEKIAMELEPNNYSQILGKFKVDTFSDGELSPQFLESIRDKKVFLVSSTTSPAKIITLLLAVDAAKRASASEVILVIPYFGYSRQDRKEGIRGAIGAKLMADLLQTSGADQLISIDLHSEQIQGFFDIPVNMIPGNVVFTKYIKSLEKDDYVICSPDAGGVKRATRFYQKFLKKFPDAHFAMLSKLRDKPNSIDRMDLIGEVKGRHVIIVDDMIDTAGTLCSAAMILKNAGARKVTAFISHGVLSGVGHQRILQSQWLDELVITDSIENKKNEKIQTISCAPAIAVAIEAIVNSLSLDNQLETI